MRDFIFAERVNNMQRKPNLRFHFLCSGFINIENNLKFVEKKNTPWFSKPFPGFSKTSKKKWEYGVTIMQSGLWLFFFYSSCCMAFPAALRGEVPGRSNVSLVVLPLLTATDQSQIRVKAQSSRSSASLIVSFSFFTFPPTVWSS